MRDEFGSFKFGSFEVGILEYDAPSDFDEGEIVSRGWNNGILEYWLIFFILCSVFGVPCLEVWRFLVVV